MITRSTYGLGIAIAQLNTDVTALQAKVADLELFKFPNATIVGAPTINNGQISGFSATDYLRFPFLVDFQNRHWSIDFSFTPGDDVTTEQLLIDGEYGLAFGFQNEKMFIRLSSDGETWDIADTTYGTFQLLPNKTYYVRITFDGTTYKVLYSIDKQTYTEDVTISSALGLYPVTILIGTGEIESETPKPFLGSLNMNDAYVIIDGNRIWSGMDDAGLDTRIATDLSNIDAAGIEKLRTLSRTEEIVIAGADIDIELQPNKFYLFGTLNSLRFTLAAETEDDTVNLYAFAFTSNAETMEAPTSILWADGIEVAAGSVTIEPGKKYEVNIRKNLALISNWKPA